MKEAADILDKMALYEMKIQQTRTFDRLLYFEGYYHLGLFLEHKATYSAEAETVNESNNPTMKRKMRKIENEIQYLLSENYLIFNSSKKETFVDRTFSSLRKLFASNSERMTQENDNEEKEEKKDYMSQMPDEIIMMLLKYVQGMNRVNLGSTCKRFRHLLLHSGLLWKSRCILWGYNSHKYALLAPQISRLIIVLPMRKNLDTFCQDLFNDDRSHMSVIHIMKPENVEKYHSWICWLRNNNDYEKYEIYYNNEYLNMMFQGWKEIYLLIDRSIDQILFIFIFLCIFLQRVYRSRERLTFKISWVSFQPENEIFSLYLEQWIFIIPIRFFLGFFFFSI